MKIALFMMMTYVFSNAFCPGWSQTGKVVVYTILDGPQWL